MRATSPAEKERPVSQPGDKSHTFSLYKSFFFILLFYISPIIVCTHRFFYVCYLFVRKFLCHLHPIPSFIIFYYERLKTDNTIYGILL